jgi:chaperonin GroES
MKFTPLGDRVVVKALEDEEKVGSIVIPDTAKEKPQRGEIIAVGPGKRDKGGERVQPEVKTGDKVLFSKWSGSEVTIEGEKLLVMNESDILAVL